MGWWPYRFSYQSSSEMNVQPNRVCLCAIRLSRGLQEWAIPVSRSKQHDWSKYIWSKSKWNAPFTEIWPRLPLPLWLGSSRHGQRKMDKGKPQGPGFLSPHVYDFLKTFISLRFGHKQYGSVKRRLCKALTAWPNFHMEIVVLHIKHEPESYKQWLLPVTSGVYAWLVLLGLITGHHTAHRYMLLMFLCGDIKLYRYRSLMLMSAF